MRLGSGRSGVRIPLAPGFFPGSSHTSQRHFKKWHSSGYPAKAPGVMGSVLGLVGPLSIYCDSVRWKVGSATSVSVWQHVKLSGPGPSLRYTRLLLGRYAANISPVSPSSMCCIQSLIHSVCSINTLLIAITISTIIHSSFHLLPVSSLTIVLATTIIIHYSIYSLDNSPTIFLTTAIIIIFFYLTICLFSPIALPILIIYFLYLSIIPLARVLTSAIIIHPSGHPLVSYSASFWPLLLSSVIS